MARRLTEKQLRFCAEYAADPNATQAYQRAFGPVTYLTSRTEGRRLLTNPHIQSEIEAAREEYRRRVRVPAIRVLRGLSEIAFADVADAFEDGTHGGLPSPKPLSQIPPATRRAITSVKVKRKRLVGGGGKDDKTEWEVEEVEYKFADKGAAFEKLCKKLGFYTDGPNHDEKASDAPLTLDSLARFIAGLVADQPDPEAAGNRSGAAGAPVDPDQPPPSPVVPE